MVDIFDEVDEELREERAAALLRRYGGLLIGACVSIVAATGGWQAWRWYQERHDNAAATAYLAAAARTEAAGVAGPNRPEAIAAFEAAAASAHDGYRLLSRLRIAALRAESGDLAGASAQWDQIAGDSGADPLLRDLASLTWCLHHADNGDPAVLEGRLRPLAAPGGVWRSLAGEQLALLDLRRGQLDAARTQLKKLTEDATAPDGVRARANAVLERIGA